MQTSVSYRRDLPCCDGPGTSYSSRLGPFTKACQTTPQRSLPEGRWQRRHRRHQALFAQQGVAAQTEYSGIQLPTHMNNTPHSRELRTFFSEEVCAAVQRAVAAGETRMKIRLTIPELNPEMDVYRIGTLLELVRELAFTLAEDGRRCKICVQQAMGQGVFQGLPLSLSGVRRIMDQMDWGTVREFVSFGQVGNDQLDESGYYILVAPQNVVGNTIMTNLGDMVSAAEAVGKTVILINPRLVDIPSAAGVMGVRGRKERMALEQSFVTAYHFRLLYSSNARMYPIRGAMRHAYGGPWEVYRRVDEGKRREHYEFLGAFESEPNSGALTPLFIRAR